jgi:hypothetical protein
MGYNLFLDDYRHPHEAFTYMKDVRYFEWKWVIAKSYDNFVSIVEELGVPDFVSFDHDLADEHYRNDENPWSVDGVDYLSYKEKTGYECAKWLCDYCLDNKIKFPEYMVHSWNAIGSKNIKNYIKNFKKYNPELT